MLQILALVGCATSDERSGLNGRELTRPASLHHELPDRDFYDVRWNTASTLLLAHSSRGIALLDIGQTPYQVRWLDAWPSGNGVGERYRHLAASHEFLAASDFAFGMRWKPRGEGLAVEDFAMEYIADIDLWNHELAFSGLRRGADGQLGLDNAFAWVGSLPTGLSNSTRVLPFTDRSLIENCAGFGLSPLRYLVNGSLAVVSGAEERIYLIDQERNIGRIWSFTELGIDVSCNFSVEEQALLSRFPASRNAWINSKTIVDEVVAFENKLGIFKRVSAGGRVTWSVQMLDADGSEATPYLRFHSDIEAARVTGDVLNDRLVVLITDHNSGGSNSQILIYD